jgi:hypothetical protein
VIQARGTTGELELAVPWTLLHKADISFPGSDDMMSTLPITVLVPVTPSAEDPSMAGRSFPNPKCPDFVTNLLYVFLIVKRSL